MSVIGACGAVGLAFLTYRESPSVGRGLYRIAVSLDGPHIQDGRFAVTEAPPDMGRTLLNEQAIDIYIDGTHIIARDDDRSKFAISALKRVLDQIVGRFRVARERPGIPAQGRNRLFDTLSKAAQASSPFSRLRSCDAANCWASS